MSDQQQGPGWWLASDGKWYPPADPGTPPTANPTATAPSAFPAAAWPVLGGAAAMIIGAFLPWAIVTAPFIGQVSKNGIEGDGVLTLLLGVVTAVLGWPLVARRNPGRGRAVGILVAAGLATAIAIYDVVDVSTAVDDVEGPVAASAGIGLYLTLAAAVAAVVGGVLALRTGDPSPDGF